MGQLLRDAALCESAGPVLPAAVLLSKLQGKFKFHLRQRRIHNTDELTHELNPEIVRHLDASIDELRIFLFSNVLETVFLHEEIVDKLVELEICLCFQSLIVDQGHCFEHHLERHDVLDPAHRLFFELEIHELTLCLKGTYLVDKGVCRVLLLDLFLPLVKIEFVELCVPPMALGCHIACLSFTMLS